MKEITYKFLIMMLIFQLNNFGDGLNYLSNFMIFIYLNKNYERKFIQIKLILIIYL